MESFTILAIYIVVGFKVTLLINVMVIKQCNVDDEMYFCC